MIITMENTAEYDYIAISDIMMSHSVLGISVRINQDGQSGCTDCFRLFTVSAVSCSFLVCLLCHLLSLCVVVFSLPPSFTCLLLPVTCTPATSSLISIHAARQSRHSGNMSSCVLCDCDFYLISCFIFIFSQLYCNFTHCKSYFCGLWHIVCLEVWVTSEDRNTMSYINILNWIMCW